PWEWLRRRVAARLRREIGRRCYARSGWHTGPTSHAWPRSPCRPAPPSHFRPSLRRVGRCPSRRGGVRKGGEICPAPRLHARCLPAVPGKSRTVANSKRKRAVFRRLITSEWVRVDPVEKLC